MRSAKEQEWFPYSLKTTCYILVNQNGVVTQVSHSKKEMQEAYTAVVNDLATLYAVWPGQWRSDLFIIDDLDLFANAVGISK